MRAHLRHAGVTVGISVALAAQGVGAATQQGSVNVADPTPSIPRFTDMTASSGVHVRLDDTSQSDPLPDAPQLVGGRRTGGVALEDLDGDGNLDLLISDIGRVHLFKGDGRGRFHSVPEQPALILRDSRHRATGLAVGDLDNDSKPDIYVAVVRGPNHLFRNEGEWRFSEIGERTGTAHPGSAYSVNLVDYDNDGWLDIFVSNRGVKASSAADDKMSLQVWPQGDPDPAMDPSTLDFLRERNVLYRNNGDGTFTDVAVEAGLTAEDRSFASAFGDYDQDGDADLYVANEADLNRLYRNNGDGTFTEVTESMGYLDGGGGMSAMWGDVNNDGRLDQLVGNMHSSTANRFIQEDYASFSTLPPVRQKLFRQLVGGNSLLIQQADGTFKNEARERGVNEVEWAWASVLADFNNDGWLDIYVANGGWRGERREDFCATFWTGLMDGMQRQNLSRPEAPSAAGHPFAGVSDEVRQSLRYRKAEAMLRVFCEPGECAPTARDVAALLPFLDENGLLPIDHRRLPRDGSMSWDGYNRNALFINPGERGGSFIRVEESPVVIDDVSRGVATGDIDNDGDMDLVVVSLTSQVKIFRNDSPRRNWVTLLLTGTTSNRSAVGAQVIVSAQGKRWLREVSAGAGWCSHQSLELEFGLGDIDAIDQIEIRWPSGHVQLINRPRVNTRLSIREPIAQQPTLLGWKRVR